MKSTYFSLLLILLCAFISPLKAQDHNEHGAASSHEKIHAHTVGIFVGYTFIPKYTSDESSTFVAPTVGLDYLYRFNHKFGLSSQNELELASYEVEKDESETLKREYALISAIVFVYEPISWWSVFAGPGYEFEKHESFYITRMGTEFTKRLNDGWSFALTMTIDIKEINTAPAAGITIFKGLGSPK